MVSFERRGVARRLYLDSLHLFRRNHALALALFAAAVLVALHAVLLSRVVGVEVGTGSRSVHLDELLLLRLYLDRLGSLLSHAG